MIKFDPHHYYLQSVQSPDHDAELLADMYRTHSDKKLIQQGLLLREDFAGTAALCFEWVKLNSKHSAIGLDIDKKALAWGDKFYAKQSKKGDYARVELKAMDVLHAHKVKADLICALNFSYFFLKQRQDILKYFKEVRAALKPEGLFILDAFGGPEYMTPSEDKRRSADGSFTFWWVVERYDAITSEIDCRIDFQVKGETLRRKGVFRYHWRLWGLRELCDILQEAGFKKLHFWAEGLDKKGHGNGRFKEVQSEENCQAWLTYIVAQS
jgi:SAM-dependent methyltransferase